MRAWLTPDDAHDGIVCYQVQLPSGIAWEACFRGAFLLLADPANWQEYGSQTPQDCADAFSEAFFLSFEQMKECESVALIGEIRLFAGVPDSPGWTPCDGTIWDIDQLPDLFEAIGSYYGGDGIDTFAVPDLLGRVPIGVGAGSGLTAYDPGDMGGSESVELTEANLASHNHAVSNASFQNSGAGAGTSWAIARQQAGAGPITTTSKGSGTGHENRQPYTAVYYYIYAGSDA